MKHAAAAIMILLLAGSAFADEPNSDGEKIVQIQKKYLSQDALAHVRDPSLQEASQWVGFGKEVGQAMNEGLSAVVTQADRFGATRVGNFVMLIIAWKVIGNQLLGVVLGLPIFIAGVALWVFSMRRFFWGIQVLESEDPQTKAKKFGRWSYKFYSSESRLICGASHIILLSAWVLACMNIIF